MSPLRALVVEDDSNNMEIILKMLHAQNIETIAVSDPLHLKSVLENALAQGEIHLVFLDLEMPNADGYQVLEFLRGQIGDNTPVVACTVHFNEITRARSAGFHSFIGKPLSLARFPSQLQRLLAGQAVWETK